MCKNCENWTKFWKFQDSELLNLIRDCSIFTVHCPGTVNIEQNFGISWTVNCWILSGTVPFLKFTVQELWKLNKILIVAGQWTVESYEGLFNFNSSLSQDYQFQVLACSGQFTVEFQEFTVKSSQLLTVFCPRNVKNSQFTIQKLYILDSQWTFNHPLLQKQYKYSPMITSDQLSALPACVFGLTHEWCSWLSNLEHHVLRF